MDKSRWVLGSPGRGWGAGGGGGGGGGGRGGDVVAQLIEPRTEESMKSVTRVRTQSGAQEKCVFPSQKCCPDSLSVCTTSVCI